MLDTTTFDNSKSDYRTISRLIISSKDPSDPMEGAATMLLFKLARELNPRGTRGGVFSR